MTEGPSLRDVLARGWLLLAASLVVGFALALFAASRAHDVYEATATLHIHAAPGRSADAQTAARTDAALLVDRDFLAQIAPRVRPVEGQRLGVDALRDQLAARAFPGTALVELKAEGPSADAASGLAGDVATAFVVFARQDALQRNASVQDEFRAQLALLTKRIAEVRRKAPSSSTAAEELVALQAQRSRLIGQQQQAVAGAAEQTLGVTMPAPPTATVHPVRPQRGLYAAAGLLLGLLAGIGLGWLRALRTTAREPVGEPAEGENDLDERRLAHS
ncbi:MAG: hypothetical protein QOE36_319 [Gaiellaceae bacterium]|nr:hypothetical protein [Gaiellaceae bacterium]